MWKIEAPPEPEPEPEPEPDTVALKRVCHEKALGFIPALELFDLTINVFCTGEGEPWYSREEYSTFVPGLSRIIDTGPVRLNASWTEGCTLFDSQDLYYPLPEDHSVTCISIMQANLEKCK
jgi:hypothetical protein